MGILFQFLETQWKDGPYRHAYNDNDRNQTGIHPLLGIKRVRWIKIRQFTIGHQ